MPALSVQRHRLAPLLLASGVGLFCGAAISKRPMVAILIATVILGVFALVGLKQRALVAGIVIVAVAPWYPLFSFGNEPPIVQPIVLSLAIAAASVVPWLWTVASDPAGLRPSRLALLYGMVCVGLVVVVRDTVGSTKELVETGSFGLLFGGAAFLGARRLATPAMWPPFCFGGIVLLVALGLLTYAADPSQRVGGFAGYPITYGGLLVTLLPGAIVFGLRSSRLIAGVTALAAGGMMLLSQSRSSWIATIVLLLLCVLVLLRLQRWRELTGVAALTLVAVIAVLATGSLNQLVEKKISSENKQSDSVTHRLYSYGYAQEQIEKRPFFGAGAPGFSAKESEQETDIGALDNGYLSTTVDVGLFGLLTVLVPLGLAFVRFGGWMRGTRRPDADEAALVFGLIGLAVITLFYDAFYWASLAQLMFAMGGTLSVGALGRPRRAPAGARREVPAFAVSSPAAGRPSSPRRAASRAS